MRAIVVVGGIVLFLVGLGWALQGAGVLMGSFMSDNPTWLWIGTGLTIVGVVVIALGLRGSPKKAAEAPVSGSRTT